jgi:hypothetical protein
MTSPAGFGNTAVSSQRKSPMPRYKMLLLTEPKKGREQEFNDWYDKVHLQAEALAPYRFPQPG